METFNQKTRDSSSSLPSPEDRLPLSKILPKANEFRISETFERKKHGILEAYIKFEGLDYDSEEDHNFVIFSGHGFFIKGIDFDNKREIYISPKTPKLHMLIGKIFFSILFTIMPSFFLGDFFKTFGFSIPIWISYSIIFSLVFFILGKLIGSKFWNKIGEMEEVELDLRCFSKGNRSEAEKFDLYSSNSASNSAAVFLRFIEMKPKLLLRTDNCFLYINEETLCFVVETKHDLFSQNERSIFLSQPEDSTEDNKLNKVFEELNIFLNLI